VVGKNYLKKRPINHNERTRNHVMKIKKKKIIRRKEEEGGRR
jgi:hypothetical protein